RISRNCPKGWARPPSFPSRTLSRRLISACSWLTTTRSSSAARRIEAASGSSTPGEYGRHDARSGTQASLRFSLVTDERVDLLRRVVLNEMNNGSTAAVADNAVYDRLLSSIGSRDARVGIVGLGYVGLPLAV